MEVLPLEAATARAAQQQEAALGAPQGGEEGRRRSEAGAETRCSVGAALRELFDPRDSLRTLLPCGSCEEASPAGGDRLACLDAVRAMAFMWVLHLHCMEFLGEDFNEDLYDEAQRAWWLRLAMTGSCGVDVFFVLSGLLIARGLFKPETAAERELGVPRAFARRYAAFLLRRFFRLWPLILLAMAFKLTLPEALFPGASTGLWEWGWTYLTFTANLIDDSADCTYVGPLWSVGVEFQMYLLTPFLCELIYSRRSGSVRRRAYWMLGLASAASVALRAFWAYGPAQLGTVEAVSGAIASAEYTNTLARMSPYISGVAVAAALEQRRARDSARTCEEAPAPEAPRAPLSYLGSAALDAMALAAVTTTCVFGWQWSLFDVETLSDVTRPLMLVLLTPAFGWGIARCIYRTVTAEARAWRCVRSLLSLRAWGGLALVSYSGYVMQDFATRLLTVPLIKALGLTWAGLDEDELATGTVRFVVVFLLHVVMCVLYALPCHLLVEVPGIRLGRRVERALRRSWERRRGQAAAAAAHKSAASHVDV